MSRSEVEKTQIAFLERLAVWQAAIDCGVFTLRDIHNRTSLGYEHLSNRIYEMYNAGVVGICYASNDSFSTRSMLAVYSVKLRNSRPNSIPRWRRNAWRSMRIYKRFTVGKIMDTLPGTDVDFGAVRRLCETLCDFDILRRDGHSTSEETPVYALVRDYGGIPACNNSLTAKPSSLLPAASNLSSASISSRTAASLLNSAASIGRAAKWEQRYLARVKHLLPGYSPVELSTVFIYDALSRSICYNLNSVIYIIHSPEGVSIHGRRKAIDEVMLSTDREYGMADMYYYNIYISMRSSEDAKELYPRSYHSRLLICHNKLENEIETQRQAQVKREKRLERALLGREIIDSEEAFMEKAVY